MDYKVIEKPPTPPESPDSRAVLASSSTASNKAIHEFSRASSPSLHHIGNSSSHCDNKDEDGLGYSQPDAQKELSDFVVASTTPSSSASLFKSSSNMARQFSSYQRTWVHHARLCVSQAGQAAANILPSSITSSYSSLSQDNAHPVASTSKLVFPSSPNGNAAYSAGKSKRQLTGPMARDKDREVYDKAWHRLLKKLLDRLPTLPTSGPKRLRTRSRRLLLLLACIASLCYIFSNTLHEAYSSAAIARGQYRRLDERLREQLGANLLEYKRHPIEDLIANAKKEWERKLARQSKTPEEGATEYKKRYKRDPPIGYKEWFEYAQEQGTPLVDEYDSLMASLEPFWAIDGAELRRRTFQIGMQPSFALVHIEEAVDGHPGGTFWDANENDDLIKPFGVERARGFERMVSPFVGKPGMSNMVFAVNELAEPRVLVPWEEKILLDQALQENTTVNLRQFTQIPGRSKTFFPDPVWKGDGTTWEHFIRTCPPESAVRRIFTTMTGNVIHLADVVHVAYNKNWNARAKSKADKVTEVLNGGQDLEVQINPARAQKRRTASMASLPAIDILAQPHTDTGNVSLSEIEHNTESGKRPGADGWPVTDVFLPGETFQFNNNVTALSHEALCGDHMLHDTQGQFCSDFRSLDSLYPVFSPSTMPGFSDIIIPSHYYAATGPKYHLAAHRKKVRKAEKDPDTGKWSQILVEEDLPAWETRYNKIFWRGSTTGGGNNPAGRQLSYQRHRFVKLTSENSSDPMGVVLPPANKTNSLAYVELPQNLINQQTMDVAFTSLDGCGHEKVCNAVKFGNYRMGSKLPLMEITKYKLLIDLDGMAYSARFMALLESGAAVLKSTIYSEYYSDQIQPWYHFIPVSLFYSEIYNIYSYFLGVSPQYNNDNSIKSHSPLKQQKTLSAPDNSGARDSALKAIGEKGQDWQTHFGKTKDMEIYCYRLALEWGRLWQRDGPVGTF